MTEPLVDNPEQCPEQNQGVPVDYQNQMYQGNKMEPTNQPYTGDNYGQDYQQDQNQIPPTNQTTVNVNYDQNYPQNQVPENNPEIQGNDMGPMYKENPDNINNNLSTYSKDNYAFSIVFIIYLIQSVIYLLIHFFGRVLFNPEILNYVSLAYFVLCLCLFFLFGKYVYSNSCCSSCSLFLFLLFSLFKICFYVILYQSSLEAFNKQRTFTELPSYLFFFSSIGTGAFYIILAIYSCIREVRLLIAFGIGFFVSLIFLVSLLFSINEAVGIFVAAFILIEVVALIISMLIAKKTNILEEGEPIHNILMIDYYKFFIIMLLSYLALMLCLLMLYLVCLILSCCSSQPTYTDSKGNIYDQFHNKMGIKLRKKPKYVSNGKFYDKHHNEIKEDNCQIF